ncbi:energy coupling factor transporter S component ThiW [Alkalibacterium iburiense]|uniref:Energy coupling factor transporter S component ThiW n=1 Tax=Alkalibacterium iburiense TaxID=290589 RepID=A0ABP3HCL1_9LACT
MKTRPLVLTALFIAIGYIGGSLIIIPLGFVRAAPFQHFMNVLVSFVLGPWYSLAQAFGISVLRNITGTGSLLAFPGSMIGAFLSGYLFQKTKRFYWLAIGEIIGTGILGALASYPIARVVMSQEAALFGFVPVFSISAIIGAVVGVILVYQLMKRPHFKERVLKWKQ